MAVIKSLVVSAKNVRNFAKFQNELFSLAVSSVTEDSGDDTSKIFEALLQ